MSTPKIIDLGAALRNSLGVTTPDNDPPVSAVDTEAAAVWERGEQRTIHIDGRVAGFVRFTTGGLWRAHSYRSGIGFGPFENEAAARQWVHEHDKPIAGYSR